jgi:hypothetical protein
MENQKALSSTQLELIRLVMKPASEAEIISEMQKLNCSKKNGSKSVDLLPFFLEK